MAEYYRILSYLYRYDKKTKMDCRGFLKAEQKRNGLKITLQIDDERLMENIRLTLCFYEKEKERWKLHPLARLESAGHHEETVLSYPAETLPDGFDIRRQHGVLLFYQEFFFYGSVWIGDEIPVEELLAAWPPEPDAGEVEEEDEPPAGASEEDGPAAGVAEAEDWADARAAESLAGAEKPEDGPVTGPGLQTGPPAGVTEEMPGAAEPEDWADARAAEPADISGRREEIPQSVDEPESPGYQEEAGTFAEEAGKADVQNAVSDYQEEAGTFAEKKPEEQLSTDSGDLLRNMWIDTEKKAKPVDNIFNPAFRSGYQISAEQLKDLSPEAGSLSDNQFLAKGYASYHHLLAGKVIYGGRERYCIGVPGIYENRERYMAQLYQFPVFLSLTENRIKTGGFGYWLHLLQE